MVDDDGWRYPSRLQLGTYKISNVTNLSGEEILHRKWATRVIVSEKSRLMYCPIPKAANSNWKYLIRKFEGYDDYDDLPKSHNTMTSGLRYLSDYSPREVEQLLKDPSYFKFTFVRDPYSRILSCYMDKFQNTDDKYIKAELKNFLAQLFDWKYVKNWDVMRDARPSFRAFVDELAKSDLANMNGHWKPQTIHCGFGEMPYDFVGRFEKLKTDAQYVLGKLGKVNEKFPTQEDIGFPSSGASSKDAEDLFTLDIMFKTRMIFNADFRILGY